MNGVRRAEVVEADALNYPFETLGPIAFALVDVDLCLPVKASLKRLWPQLMPGRLILVDDCDRSVREWDGAL